MESQTDWYMAVAALSSAARACATMDPLDPRSDCNLLALSDITLSRSSSRPYLTHSFSDVLLQRAELPAVQRSLRMAEANDEECDEDEATEGLAEAALATPKFLASYLRRVSWIERQRQNSLLSHTSALQRVQEELRLASERRKIFSRKRLRD
jgi:hypothetical protein